MFWALAALMTLAVVAAVALPLLRARGGGPGRAAFDRAVYRDQLAEIGRDLERGVLSEKEATAARLEVERRLLATAEESEPAAAGRVDPITVASLSAAVAAGAVAVYMALGSPQLPAQPVAARVPEQAPRDLAASAEALENRLRENPKDIDGWMLLARTQAVLERFTAAAESYRRVLQMAPRLPDAASGYGEMLVLSGDGVVTAPAADSFRIALAGDPQNVAARFYLASADAQAGRAREAIDGWSKLEADSPADAPWRPALRQRIEETAKEAGLPVPPAAAPAAVAAAAPPSRPAPPPPAGGPRAQAASGAGGPRASAAGAAPEAPRGPTAADMAAAQGMRPEDRQQMIRSMVDGLAARLEQNPNDAAGWQRLGRAWRVLGERKKAEEALAKAALLRPTDAEAALDHARAVLEAEGGSPDAKTPLPESFVSAVKRVAQLDPKNPEALWYLGLAAAQRQDKGAAARHWKELLAMLPPGSEDHRTVKEALDALGAK